jgi:hypothetical protein
MSHLLKYLFHGVLITNSQLTAQDVDARLKALASILGNTQIIYQMFESIKDSSVKLQCSYLNIVNIILYYSNLVKQKPKADVSTGEVSNVVLRMLDPIKNYLCADQSTLLPCIMSLLEHSSSQILRGKAAICVTLLDSCVRNKPSGILSQIAENRRFVNMLSKGLESNQDTSYSSHNNSMVSANSPAAGGRIHGSSGKDAEYMNNCVVALLVHIRSVLLTALDTVRNEFQHSFNIIITAGVSQINRSVMSNALSHLSTIRYHCESIRCCVTFAANSTLFKHILSFENILRLSAELMKVMKHGHNISVQYFRPQIVLEIAQVDEYKALLALGEQTALNVLETISLVS